MRTAIPYTIDVANGNNAIVVPMLITSADLQVIINCTQSKLILTKLDKETGIVSMVQDAVAGTTTINVTPADPLVDLSCDLDADDDIDIELDDKVSAKYLKDKLDYLAAGCQLEENEDEVVIDGVTHTGLTLVLDVTASVDGDTVELDQSQEA